MVGLAAIGKAGVFVLVGAYWLAGAAPGRAAAAAVGDLVLAVLFTRWLISSRRVG